uniref:Thioredoxin domain-containing protein n=1 Tax=Chaetoceros debilis TaxID=122233 RepID=A0A6S8VA44_9STRA
MRSGMYRLSILTLARSALLVESFSIRSQPCSIRSRSSHNRYSGISTFSTAEDNAATDGGVELPEISSMRIRAIKDELNEMGISFTDCFDKDSLVDRLKDGRSGAVTGTPKSVEDDASKSAAAASTSTSESTCTPKSVEDDASKSAAEASTSTSESTSKHSQSSKSTFDREAVISELRQKKVRELRTMCAQNNIKWATFIEKEELVRALVDYKEKASDFSSSGALTPGKVTMINDDILGKEVSGGAATPLLLDVYATWCGPCKMMVPQLDEAAAELGDKVRVAKIDSDEYPEWAGRLQVKGLPTLIVFDGNGKEVERVEGALMKDQLVQLAQKHA